MRSVLHETSQVVHLKLPRLTFDPSGVVQHYDSPSTNIGLRWSPFLLIIPIGIKSL